MVKNLVFCFALYGAVQNGYAQKLSDTLKVQNLGEVVLSDSRFELKRENSGKVITKITPQELDQFQGQSIAQIINRMVGVEVNGTGSNAGQNLSYYVRGGRNRQVLIMIDGIQVTDPSQIANDYDLRLLNADQVHSIEILKGASSTLYGSGAATAVINIKLKEPEDKPFNINLRSTMGSNRSAEDDKFRIEDYRNSATFSGRLRKLNYLASFGQQYTDGLSALEVGTESDPFKSYNGNLKLGYSFNKHFSLTTYTSFDNFEVAFDDSFAGTDTDFASVSEQYRFGLSSNYTYNKGSLTLNTAFNTIDRNINTSFPSQFIAQSVVLDAYNRYTFNESFYTVLGLNYQKNEMESLTIPEGSEDFETNIIADVAQFTITDPYINGVFISSFGLNVNAGVRLNNHSVYGTHLVYSLNPSFRKEFNFGYLKGLVSYSTAYITPSLFQLFEPSFGNTELEPEENQTFELGAELFLSDAGTFSLVYFNRNEDDVIDFVDTGNFVFQYQNITESFTAHGVEIVAQYKLNDNLNFNGNITYTKVEENLNIRIPKFMANLRLDYTPYCSTTISLNYQYNGDRTDTYFDNETFETKQIILDSFGLLDFYVSQQILGYKMTLFANITNALNANYQEIFRFTTRGRNFNVGFSLVL